MVPSTTISLNVPSEPDPNLWLTDERREQLRQLTTSARPLLTQAGLWRATLGYWVREQASLQAKWDPLDEKECIDALEKKWRESTPSDRQNFDPLMLRAKLRVAPAAARWSREQWSHRLDSLFLQSKSQLDRASCRVIRVGSKPLATELYHRIKAGETTFSETARDFGEGPERNQNGLISERPLVSMPFGLAPVLEHLQVGQMSQPMRLGKGFCIVELIMFKNCKLDVATSELLLAEQLRLWIDSVVDVLEVDLR